MVNEKNLSKGAVALSDLSYDINPSEFEAIEMEHYITENCLSTRIKISQIVTNNFLGRGQVVLQQFHNESTAVVGQNGRGEKTLISSLLFVFGYGFKKNVPSKIEEVFSALDSSFNSKDVSMCSVDIHLQIIYRDPIDNIELPLIECSDIVIGRRRYQNNTSEYILNNDTVEFSEIVQYLSNFNLDIEHSDYLILLDDIEYITTMKPHGNDSILNYLDNRFGTVQFAQRIRKSLKTYKKLNVDFIKMQNVCRSTNEEIQVMKSTYKDTVEYIKDYNKVAQMKNLYLQKYIAQLQTQYDEFQLRYEKNNVDVVNLSLNLQTCTTDILEKKFYSKSVELILSSMKESNVENINDFLKKRVVIEKKLKDAILFKKNLQLKIADNNKQIKENDKFVQSNLQEIGELNKLCEFLRSEKNKIKQPCQVNSERLILVIESAQEKTESLNLELQHLRRNEKYIDVDITKTLYHIIDLKNETTAENVKLQEIQLKLKSSSDTINWNLELISESQLIIDQTQIKLQVEKFYLKKNQELEDSLKAELIKHSIKIKQLSKILLQRPKNIVLDALMQQKSEGKISGILGRFGDLGAIDHKYQLAISTACKYLNYLVVDTYATVLECINYLKTHKIGNIENLSFITLENVQDLEYICRSEFQGAPNVKRLFDLIRVEDERVLPVFYFALHDILVADNLDEAARLVSHEATECRVVTIEGDLIGPTGVISGGHINKMQGGMAETVVTKTIVNGQPDGDPTVNQLTKTTTDLQNLQKEEEQLLINKMNCQNEQEVRRRKIMKLFHKLENLKLDLKILVFSNYDHVKVHTDLIKQVKLLEKRVVELVTEDENHLMLLINKIEMLKEKLNNTTEKIQKILDEMIQINRDHISKLNSVTTWQEEENTCHYIAHINKVEEKLFRLQADIVKTDGLSHKMRNEIVYLKNKIMKSDKQCQEFDKYLNIYNTEVLQMLFEVNALNIPDVQIYLQNLNKEIEQLQKRQDVRFLVVSTLKEILISIYRKMLTTNVCLKEYKSKLTEVTIYSNSCYINQSKDLKVYTIDELNSYNLQDLAIQLLKAGQKLGGISPNLSIIHNFNKKKAKYFNQLKRLKKLQIKQNKAYEVYDQFRNDRYNLFMENFNILRCKINEIYQIISRGGDADLCLVDAIDPFINGIEFKIKPPNENCELKMSELTVRDQRIASFSLVVAILDMNLSPLFIFEGFHFEDADAFVFQSYIENYKNNSQFIILTSQPSIFGFCKNILGIYGSKSDDLKSTVIGISNENPKNKKRIRRKDDLKPTMQKSKSLENFSNNDDLTASPVDTNSAWNLNF